LPKDWQTENLFQAQIMGGRTGVDSSLNAQTGLSEDGFVGLVKTETKKINADHQDLALAA